MNYLSAESLSKSYNDRWLFKSISFGISVGEKIALVGENGAGKSTLLKIFIGEETADEGSVSVKDGLRLGYLHQQKDVAAGQTINDIVFDEGNEVAKVVKEYEIALHSADVSPEKMQDLLHKMEEYNAWDYESKVHEITSKLGLVDLGQAFDELSGGQRKRVFLAQLLLSEPDLIVLDEPTNHLDLSAIEWLENYLKGQQITLIMVTHDRYFLDTVATQIIELDKGKLFRYKGNYAYFLEKKSERETMLQTEVSKAKNLMKKELEWMRRQPKARGTKSKSRIDAFYGLQETASQNLKKDKLELSVKEARQGGKVLELHAASKNFGDKKIIDKFSYIFKKKDRIGIVGKNGVGKSTFLNLLTEQITPDSGQVIKGQTTQIGYFTQETASLNPANRVIDEVKEIAEYITMSDGSQLSASRFLEQFLFPVEKQYGFLDKLSGGEKKRLQLLKVLVKNPNFLILDEPTNDFDIDSLNILEDFLENFSGCLLLVSHDRYFMDHLVDELFVFEGEGVIRPFNGNYSLYRQLEEEKENASTKKPTKQSINSVSTPKASNVDKRKPSFKEKNEYETLQKQIDALELEKKSVIEKMNSPSLDYIKLTEYGKIMDDLTSDIDEKTLRWMELDELM